MNVHLTLVSTNAKTGPIPVSTSSRNTCPDTCPLNGNGCYAQSGPLALHWRAVTDGKRGMSWDDFTDQVSRFRRGQLWRHNQAGDLPGENTRIDGMRLRSLVRANKKAKAKGFTYTHKPVSIAHNAAHIALANSHGFTINLSADNLTDADTLYDLGIAPVVTLVPEDSYNAKTPAGTKVVICPAQTHDYVTCASCGMCAIGDRDFIIGFRVHGTSKKKAANVFYRGE